MFVKFSNADKAGRTTMWCNAGPGAQEALLGSLDQSFFKPPYVGDRGWIFYVSGRRHQLGAGRRDCGGCVPHSGTQEAVTDPRCLDQRVFDGA